jgi:hypothetical protein
VATAAPANANVNAVDVVTPDTKQASTTEAKSATSPIADVAPTPSAATAVTVATAPAVITATPEATVVTAVTVATAPAVIAATPEATVATAVTVATPATVAPVAPVKPVQISFAAVVTRKKNNTPACASRQANPRPATARIRAAPTPAAHVVKTPPLQAEKVTPGISPVVATIAASVEAVDATGCTKATTGRRRRTRGRASKSAAAAAAAAAATRRSFPDLSKPAIHVDQVVVASPMISESLHVNGSDNLKGKSRRSARTRTTTVNSDSIVGRLVVDTSAQTAPPTDTDTDILDPDPVVADIGKKISVCPEHLHDVFSPSSGSVQSSPETRSTSPESLHSDKEEKEKIKDVLDAESIHSDKEEKEKIKDVLDAESIHSDKEEREKVKDVLDDGVFEDAEEKEKVLEEKEKEVKTFPSAIVLSAPMLAAVEGDSVGKNRRQRRMALAVAKSAVAAVGAAFGDKTFGQKTFDEKTPDEKTPDEKKLTCESRDDTSNVLQSGKGFEIVELADKPTRLFYRLEYHFANSNTAELSRIFHSSRPQFEIEAAGLCNMPSPFDAC